MTAAENVALLTRWYREVWREGKDQTIYELLAPDASLRGQIAPDVEVRGPEEFVGFAKRIRDTFPDIEVTLEDVFAVDDKVAARWVAIGTHAGDGLGIPPTGKRVQITGITIAHFVNGKVVRGWDNWDRLSMLEQIGAYTSPEAVVLEKSA
jgi:steroid delta-isomerase-like uncharacterized protein